MEQPDQPNQRIQTTENGVQQTQPTSNGSDRKDFTGSIGENITGSTSESIFESIPGFDAFETRVDQVIATSGKAKRAVIDAYLRAIDLLCKVKIGRLAPPRKFSADSFESFWDEKKTKWCYRMKITYINRFHVYSDVRCIYEDDTLISRERRVLCEETGKVIWRSEPQLNCKYADEFAKAVFARSKEHPELLSLVLRLDNERRNIEYGGGWYHRYYDGYDFSE